MKLNITTIDYRLTHRGSNNRHGGNTHPHKAAARQKLFTRQTTAQTFHLGEGKISTERLPRESFYKAENESLERYL